jgi:hypothetical protein
LALEKMDAARALFAQATGWRPAASAPPAPDLLSVAARFAVVESRVLQRFQGIVATHAPSGAADARLAESLEQDVLEPWRSAQAQVHLSSRTLPPEQRATIDRLDQYMRLREQSWGLLIEGLREGNQEKVTQSQQLSQEADALAGRVWSARGN